MYKKRLLKMIHIKKNLEKIKEFEAHSSCLNPQLGPPQEIALCLLNI